MRRTYNLTLLSSFGLFLLLSCANTSTGKQSENKSATSVKQNQTEGEAQGDVSLNRKEVLSGKATLLLPKEFGLMDTEMLTAKYPITGHRPTEVYTNKAGTINVALSYTQNKAEEKDLEEVKKAMEAQFNQPAIDFVQSSMQRINGQQYIQLEFIAPAVDGKIYNLLQITSFEGYLVIFAFNCTENYRKGWEATGKDIMQSIEMK